MCVIPLYFAFLRLQHHLKHGDKYMFATEGPLRHLKVNNCSVEDTEEITAVARVNVFSASKAPLSVIDKPDSVTNLSYREIRHDYMVLCWSPPIDMGGRPMLQYLVEIFDQWRTVSEKDSSPESVIMMYKAGVRQSQSYKFPVTAINELGAGEPKETNLEVAEDRFADPPLTPVVEDVTDTTINLSWKPICSYVLEGRRPGEDDWTTMVKTVDCECQLADLETGREIEFRVRAVSELRPGNPSKSTGLIPILLPQIAPTINLDDLKDIKVKAGVPIEVNVGITGSPVPEAHWFIGDEELVPGEDIIMETSKKLASLRLTNTSKRYTGPLKLVLTNVNGTAEGTCNCVVLGKPTAPAGPLVAKDITKDSCVLAWNQPVDTGGVPLTGFVIEKMDKASGTWVKVGNCLPEKTTYKVKDLKNKNKLRVSAKNMVGMSLPLQAEAATYIRRPNFVSKTSRRFRSIWNALRACVN